MLAQQNTKPAEGRPVHHLEGVPIWIRRRPPNAFVAHYNNSAVKAPVMSNTNRYNVGTRQTLRLHPESSCFAVTRIDVKVLRPQAHNLTFAYVVTGTIRDLAVPSATAGARTDELWRHTCFEAFVGSLQSVAYYEFNFAPSTQWAAYRFSDYRTNMRVATEINAPRITVRSNPERYVLQASLELGQLLFSRSSTLRVGLSAVLEEINGHRSYWALAHPPGKVDFHHSDSFALEVM
jgi:hypothetical protein